MNEYNNDNDTQLRERRGGVETEGAREEEGGKLRDRGREVQEGGGDRRQASICA